MESQPYLRFYVQHNIFWTSSRPFGWNQVHVQSDPAGRLVISGEPEQPDNPWGVTPFKKVVPISHLWRGKNNQVVISQSCLLTKLVYAGRHLAITHWSASNISCCHSSRPAFCSSPLWAVRVIVDTFQVFTSVSRWHHTCVDNHATCF